MSPTDTRTIHLPRPLPHQVPVLDADYRFKTIVAGRRWGKTVLGLVAAIYGHGPSGSAKFLPHSRFKFPGALDGGNIWWIAPTHGIGDILWRTVKDTLRDAWEDKSEERRILLPGGGSISVKSAVTPDQSLRGAGLDGLIIDEAAYVRREAWIGALRPALADREGWAIFISTPAGENWYFDLFQNAKELPGWMAFQSPSWNNPILGEAEIEEMRATMSSNYFRQEVGAEFVAPGAGMFNAEWFERRDLPPDRARRCRMWDFAATGKIKQTIKTFLEEPDPDYTAGALVSVGVAGDWCIEDIRRVQTTPMGVEQLVISTAHKDTKTVPIYIEQEPGASGKLVVDYFSRHKDLRGYTVRAYKPSGPKEVRAQPFSAQAEHGHVSIVKGAWNRDFLDEVHIFPGGPHDDQVDAVSAAFDVLTTGSWASPVAPISIGKTSAWRLG